MTTDKAITYLNKVRNRWSFRGATSTNVMLGNVIEVIEQQQAEIEQLRAQQPYNPNIKQHKTKFTTTTK